MRMHPHFSSPMAASPLAEPKAEQHPLERTLHDRRLIVTRSRTARPSSELGATPHSSAHRLLAWLADEAGSELYTVSACDEPPWSAPLEPERITRRCGRTR